MPKKCIICGDEAKFSIKDTSDHYCEECAQEHFGDISLLVKVEDQAKKIKKMLDDYNSELPDSPDEAEEEDKQKKADDAAEDVDAVDEESADDADAPDDTGSHDDNADAPDDKSADDDEQAEETVRPEK